MVDCKSALWFLDQYAKAQGAHSHTTGGLPTLRVDPNAAFISYISHHISKIV